MENEKRTSALNLNSVLESESHEPMYDVNGFTFDREIKPSKPSDLLDF